MDFCDIDLIGDIYKVRGRCQRKSRMERGGIGKTKALA
jgi:hypothetical protein